MDTPPLTSSAAEKRSPFDSMTLPLYPVFVRSRPKLSLNDEMLSITLPPETWSVFWMDRSSLGDRINVSFIGILTVVAYQIVLSEILPRISYMTLMNGFLNFSFFIVCASVVVNLVVSSLDKQGRFEEGDRVDERCRWIFPLTYFGLLLFTVGMAFLAF